MTQKQSCFDEPSDVGRRSLGVSDVVVITGASAGVGRATAIAFARRGCDVALIARNSAGLECAAEEVRAVGVRALPVAADVADFDALHGAAQRVERELGPIKVWVNNAMATVFAPVQSVTPDEFRRSTEVTYLGQVYGTMIALSHMRPRDQGVIVNIGSALAYRAIPLQSAYCGAKHAVRGFTDALRCELLHDASKVRVTMVHLPALNTPQFDWALNRMKQRPQPVPPIYQPEVAARAVVFAACHDRREVWVGAPTVETILANRIAPGLLDRVLAKLGCSGQLTDEPKPDNAPSNLFASVSGLHRTHGRFGRRARTRSWLPPVGPHSGVVMAAALALSGGVLAALVGEIWRANRVRPAGVALRRSAGTR